MKLWQKEESIDKIFERFTVGKDPELDVYLAKYDIIGSRAHVKMLGQIGLLKSEEIIAISLGLDNIDQMIFIKTIISYLSKNGTIDKTMLYQSPFTDLNDQGIDGVFDNDIRKTKVFIRRKWKKNNKKYL